MNAQVVKELESVLSENRTKVSQSLIPKLRKNIRRLQIDPERMDVVQCKMQRISREKSHISIKMGE